MKKVMIIALLLNFGFLVSCGQGETSQYPGYEKMEDKLYIKQFKENPEGREIAKGDVLTLRMKYTTQDDSLLFETMPGQPPVQMQADTSKFEGDFMGIFIGMHEGDSMSVIVDADNFFMKTAGMPQRPQFIDSGSVLYFTVGIEKVQTMAELEAAKSAANAEKIAEEQAILQEYLNENSITAEPTPSGLIFISKKEGTGKKPVGGDQVRVNYEGRLINGTYFDTSIEEVAKEQGLYDERRPYEPFQFTLGQGQVIQGWDEGIAMLKEGGKATLIIPSTLGYGANPRPGGVIQPFNTLIFEVELVEVVKN